MQKGQVLNQEEADQELPSLIAAFKTIYRDKTDEVSYTDTYKSVYRLCKRGLQDKVIENLIQVSAAHFKDTFSEMNGDIIQDFKDLTQKFKDAIERILEILLYIQTNYFHECKREYRSIKEMLNAVLYEQMCQDPTIFKRISEYIAKTRIKEKQGEINCCISIINNLDQKQTFFENYFIPHYQPLLMAHYAEVSEQNYKKLSQQQFFMASKQILQNEREWLKKYLLRMKGKKALQAMMKTFYKAVVEHFKQRVYEEQGEDLFNRNTLQFLQLLNEKGEQKEINSHNQWFMAQTKKKLDKLDQKNNSQFLISFIELYKKISECLSNTKNFNIRYKATFFFEHWINDEKIYLPKRLNFYIEEIISGKVPKEDCLPNFKILFKLLKEKDFFEKQFRKSFVYRNVYEVYDAEIEDKIIESMAEECGEDWIEKISKLKQAIVEKKKEEYQGKFQAIGFEDTAWPLEKGKIIAELPSQLIEMTSEYTNKYELKFKGRKVLWHPIHGVVVLSIKFNQEEQTFKMDTIMASLLLYLQKLKNQCAIKDILIKSHYTYGEVEEALKILSKAEVILLSSSLDGPQAKDVQVSLNLNYTQKSEGVIDLTARYSDKKLQCGQNEELKADRKMMVEAMIVKIMKQAKLITLPKLYEAITPVIESRGFQFNQTFVDNTFKGLVDKNYVRNLEDGSYSYIAA